MGRASRVATQMKGMGYQSCIFVIWLAIVLVGSSEGVELLDDARSLVEKLHEDQRSSNVNELGEADTDGKVSGAPLPCCLQDPVPAGCRCFLVKAQGGGGLEGKTNEAKQKSIAAKGNASKTKSKERQLKRMAKGLAKSGQADRNLKRAAKNAKREMRRANRAAKAVRRAKKAGTKMGSKVAKLARKASRAKHAKRKAGRAARRAGDNLRKKEAKLSDAARKLRAERGRRGRRAKRQMRLRGRCQLPS